MELGGYVKAFVSNMPKRATLMRSIVLEKREIDKRLRNEEWNSGDIKRLKEIVGKDTLFKSGELRGKKSLRHYTWKFYKSFDFMRVVKQRIAKSPVKKASVSGSLNFYLDLGIKLGTVSKDLDEIYKTEMGALEGKRYEDYIALANDENRLYGLLDSYVRDVGRHSNNLHSLCRLLANTESGKTNDPKSTMTIAAIIFGSLVTFFLFGVAVGGNLIEAVMKKTWGIQQNKINATGIWGFVISYSFLIFGTEFLHKTMTEFIKETL